MKKILLSVLMLFFISAVFAQRMDWNVFAFPPEKGSYTYVDSTTLIYSSGDGKLSFTYELIGDVLNYDVNVSIPASTNQYDFYSGGFHDDYFGVQFWNIEYVDYKLGTQNFSGSVILDYTEPVFLALFTGIEAFHSGFELWGGWLMPTYYPY